MRVAQAHAEQAAAGDGVERMDELIPLAEPPLAVVPRVQKHHETRHPIRLGHDAHDAHRHHQTRHDGHGARRHLPQPHDREDAHDADHRRAEVGLLGQDEQDRRKDEHEDLDEERAEGQHALAQIREQARAHEHEHDLGELRRLEARRAEHEPAARAPLLVAHPDEHRGHEQDRRKTPRHVHERAAPNRAGQKLPNGRRKHEAGHGVAHLPEHVSHGVGRIRRIGVRKRDDRRGGVDHDEPDEDEREHAQKHDDPGGHDVRGRLPLRARPSHASP